MRFTALRAVHELAKKNPEILFIGSDLGAGTLQGMKDDLPKQFFMEGISEQHIIGFAAGLASNGFRPYLNTIATFFSRRAYEQILIDIGLHNLPVKILASGGGMVYAPLGPTHTAIEDFSLMLNIPNMKVFAPADACEMENLIKFSATDSSPYYIRFGKGGEEIVTSEYNFFDFNPKVFGELNSDIMLFTTGIMLQHCLNAQRILVKKGISSVVVHFPYLNDLDLSGMISAMNNASILICVEEHIPKGGLCTQLLHELNRLGNKNKHVLQLALPHSFSHNYGSQLEHLDFSGLNGSKIAQKVEGTLGEIIKKTGNG